MEWSPAPTKNKQVTACALCRTTAGMFSSCTRLRTGTSEAGISEARQPAHKTTAKNPPLDLSLSSSVCLGVCACQSMTHPVYLNIPYICVLPSILMTVKLPTNTHTQHATFVLCTKIKGQREYCDINFIVLKALGLVVMHTNSWCYKIFLQILTFKYLNYLNVQTVGERILEQFV